MDLAKSEREVQEYLAKIRKTIAESNAFVEQIELRKQETDKLLASQGLTREQILAMHFTPSQIEAVNAELKRRNLDEIDPADLASSSIDESSDSLGLSADSADDGDLERRREKFSMMMKPFQL